MMMVMVVYTLVVYPGIIGGLEAGSLSIPEAVFELIAAAAIHGVIYAVWPGIADRKYSTRRRARQ